MRSLLVSLALLALTLALPGCLGGGGSITGPTTTGDQGRTTWQINDGLCGGGLFGDDCDLNQHIAVGGAPLVQIRGRNGTDLTGATLTGSTGVNITGLQVSTDDHGALVQAHVAASAAGLIDVIVHDASGREIDRAHITFVTAATLRCGELRSSVTRDLNFPGLTTGVTVDVATPAGSSGGSTTLACRADDASGNALITVEAIRWTVASGAVGTIDVHSDDLLGSTPADGATARVTTVGTGHATIHAALGSIGADVAVTFH